MKGDPAMWTPETVRIRFVEAAGTERFLSALRLPTANGYWPEFPYDNDDRDGWDQAAKDDHLAIWQGRGTAKADALSRYQECLSWTIERITDPERRRLVWGFAFCRAYKREFGKWCDEHGKAKSTAYNRLNRIWDHLAFNFNNERLLLREPSPYWVGHETQPEIEIPVSNETSLRHPTRIVHLPYITEKPTDTLKTPAAVEAFISHLEDVNAQRRKERARRFRMGSKEACADIA